MPTTHALNWTPDSWKSRLTNHQTVYPDRQAVEAAVAKLAALPPLVTSWEIERLKSEIADAQRGERFLLQGGDCAEAIADCTPDAVTSKLKILLQMSLVLIHASKKPVIRVGRFAGQYAKPRSSATETRVIDGAPVSLPSYYGDLVNRAEFTPEARRPDPARMVEGYQHAALTLNFIRSLLEGGFADLHHPEYWDLGFLRHAAMPVELRVEYERMTERLGDGLRFMEAIGERRVEEISRMEFFTSHEGLNLLYESAQTRKVPRREGHYNLTTHLPWIGERTRAIDGAHVEYFRGVRNPLGIKIGPGIAPEELLRLIDTLNPDNEAGRIVLIHRMGARKVKGALPGLVEVVQRSGKVVLWMSDPMHGNSTTTSSGIKTRLFSDVLEELESSWDIHASLGSRLGGVHFELTGEDVTECMGGASGITEADLSRNYVSVCDPRLNYDQAMEMAFRLARRMGER
ncbi:MAG: 3-deoxy-7-phosphoheptulonate synthase [Pyrinomonadaceae bacterium]|nr:3-deoxy-7-phosphoheptulonate synthase [Phycisphaerales bacterium]